jgi:hypothetical protein
MGWLEDGDVGRFGPLQDLVNRVGDAVPEVRKVDPYDISPPASTH